MRFCSLVVFVSACLLSAPTAHAQQPTSSEACTDWQTCRDLAEQARAAGDYETFHDLAWRSVQTRGRRDPDLFFLLARAQSLSGRPADALVTLQRLAQEMHAPKDVSEDDDFRRVRALARWPEVQSLIAQEQPSVPTEGSDADVRKAPTAEPSAGASVRGPTAERAWEEVARFPARLFDAGGLAYDAVSRRFVIGNLPARKLTIVEEGTNRAATLSGDAAQLLNVRALEIDRSQGDLWVVSEGSRDGSAATSELHKLQLVSGRVLTIYAAEPGDPPSRFVDVAIGRGSEVLVLDAGGPRLLRPTKNSHLASVMDLPKGDVTSLAPADDGRTVYVAYADHVARVDLSTKHVDRVIGHTAEVSGFTRVRWHKGSLVGAQVADGKPRIVQLRLRNGVNVASVRILDGSDAASTSLAALDLLEDNFFYLVPGEPQASIRRIRLK